jgi:hypothetical protein
MEVFCPEDGSNIFFRKICIHVSNNSIAQLRLEVVGRNTQCIVTGMRGLNWIGYE